MFKIIPILMGVVVSYVVAAVLNAIGLTNPDGSAILDFSTLHLHPGLACRLSSCANLT